VVVIGTLVVVVTRTTMEEVGIDLMAGIVVTETTLMCLGITTGAE